jgi:hypothetical protein
VVSKSKTSANGRTVQEERKTRLEILGFLFMCLLGLETKWAIISCLYNKDIYFTLGVVDLFFSLNLTESVVGFQCVLEPPVSKAASL